jgi:hypothetical protein
LEQYVHIIDRGIEDGLFDHSKPCHLIHLTTKGNSLIPLPQPPHYTKARLRLSSRENHCRVYSSCDSPTTLLYPTSLWVVGFCCGCLALHGVANVPAAVTAPLSVGCTGCACDNGDEHVVPGDVIDAVLPQSQFDVIHTIFQ